MMLCLINVHIRKHNVSVYHYWWCFPWSQFFHFFTYNCSFTWNYNILIFFFPFVIGMWLIGRNFETIQIFCFYYTFAHYFSNHDDSCLQKSLLCQSWFFISITASIFIHWKSTVWKICPFPHFFVYLFISVSYGHMVISFIPRILFNLLLKLSKTWPW